MNQQKELTADRLQGLVDDGIGYLEIMRLYSFTSVRYFKEFIRTKGYKLRRDVMTKDNGGKLWKTNQQLQ